ncbi:unnamed protein product [Pleuronectes platessa]|uniref:Uncharacterized protein n=1 Tax=Pleuronectes platessa TaxID=8262 RepID=A0A9N7UKN4_PLEPL|nr:unnamed protein product [Pleuronectes platessa]
MWAVSQLSMTGADEPRVVQLGASLSPESRGSRDRGCQPPPGETTLLRQMKYDARGYKACHTATGVCWDFVLIGFNEQDGIPESLRIKVLHPDVARVREEPGPRPVIRRGNEMGRKVAKWLPGALLSTLQHMHSAKD